MSHFGIADGFDIASGVVGYFLVVGYGAILLLLAFGLPLSDFVDSLFEA